MKRCSVALAMRKAKGFSLVETMIALTLGLVLVGGAIQIFVSNKQTYNIQEAFSRLQENGRFAVEFLSEDIRMAGFMGCGSGGAGTAKISNTINGGGAWMYISDPITGYNGGGNGETANTFPSQFAADAKTYSDPIPDPDSIVIRRGDSDHSFTVTDHNPDSSVISVSQSVDFAQGEILMMADPNCTQIGIMQFTHPATGPEKVDHNPGGSVSPGNCTKSVWPPDDSYADSLNPNINLTCTHSPAPKANIKGNAFPPGSALMRFSVHAYYIGLSSGIPALFREVLIQSGGNASSQKEELVQGVENMQILYGYDSAAAGCDPLTVTGCGIADKYLRADQVPAGAWTNKIVSVRILLLLRSITQVATSPQSYVYGGTTFNPTDRYLRREYSTTIQLRNRGAL